MLSAELRESLATAAGRYALALASDLQAQSYLLGRGIGVQTQDAFLLGVVDGSIPEHASYQGWLCIPYQTRLGGVVSLKFRRTDDGEPKYIGPYPTRPYNTLAMDRAEQLGYVALCEGEFDAIILDGLCGIPAVGVPGVEVWTAHPEWREMFTGYSRVLVFADQDEAGQKLAGRILRDLDTAHLVSLPAKDVNQAFLDFGSDKIRELAGVQDGSR